MSLEIPRPVDPSLHPLVTGNYRIATPAIEAFYELVVRCLRYRIMGALIYGPSRIGKTRAIEYVRLLLARNYPRMTSYHAQCEHKPRHAEGPFFANLLEAVGDPDPNAGSNPSKRMRLTLRIRQAASIAGSGVGCSFAMRHSATMTTNTNGCVMCMMRWIGSRSSCSRSSSASRSCSHKRLQCRSRARRRSSRV